MIEPEAPKIDLNSPPKIITFDCYGTLVQWHEVLRREIGAILVGQGPD
jgi:2-haloacid dehalogenase